MLCYVCAGCCPRPQNPQLIDRAFLSIYLPSEPAWRVKIFFMSSHECVKEDMSSSTASI